MTTFEQRHHRPKPPKLNLIDNWIYQKGHPLVVSVMYCYFTELWRVEQSGESIAVFDTWREAYDHACRLAYE